MTTESSWSMRGVDPRARKRARDAAREDGVTVGEWINRKILNGGHDGDADPRSAEGLASAIDRLSRRIEAAEHRSTLAITGIDQSVLGLVSRIQAAEGQHTDLEQRHEQALDDLLNARSALLERIQRLEGDDEASARNLAALKSLEASLARLSAQVADSADALSARANDAEDRLNELDAHLSDQAEALDDRFTALDEARDTDQERLDSLSHAISGVDARVDQAETHAEQAKLTADQARDSAEELRAETTRAQDAAVEAKMLAGTANARAETMETALETGLAEEAEHRQALVSEVTAHADRLAAAENATNAAIRSLEASFSNLESRVNAVSADGAADLREEFGDQLSELGHELSALVDTTRETLAERLKSVASEQRVDALEVRLDSVSADIALSEQRRARALDRIVHEVARVASAVDEKIADGHDRTQTMLNGYMDDLAEQNAAFAERSEAAAERSEAASARTEQLIEDGVSRLDDAHQAHIERLEKLAEMAGEGSPMREKLEARLRQMEQKNRAEMSAVREEVEKVSDAQHRALDAIENLDDRVDDLSRELGGHRTQINLDTLDDRLRANEERTRRMVEEIMARSPRGETSSSPEDRSHIGPSHTDAGAMSHAALDAPADERVSEEPSAPDMAPVSARFGATSTVSQAFVELDARVDALADGPPSSVPEDAAAPSAPAAASTLANVAGDDPDAAYLAALDSQAEPTSGPRPLTLPGRAAFAEDPSDASSASTVQFRERNGLTHGDDPFVGPDIDDEHDGVSGFQDDAPEYEDEDLRGLPDDLAQAVLKSRERALEPPLRPQADEAEAGHVERAPQSGRGGRGVLIAASGMAFAAVGAAAYFLYEDRIEGQSASADRPTPSPGTSRGGDQSMVNPTQGLSEDLAQADGDLGALYQIGVEHLEAGNRDTRAALVLKAAAEQGLPAAQFQLAKLYEDGRGLERDLDASRQWAERAANAGHVQAMHDLGVKFAHAKGAPQSYEIAARWFEQAARRGARDSQYNLGVLYEQGLGTQQNLYQAYVWYAIAAASGDEEARTRASEVGLRLSREELDAAEAEIVRFAPQAVSPGGDVLAGGAGSL